MEKAYRSDKCVPHAKSGPIFAQQGMEVQPYPTDYRAEIERLTLFSFVPQAYILADSCLAIKEYIGLGAAYFHLQ